MYYFHPGKRNEYARKTYEDYQRKMGVNYSCHSGAIHNILFYSWVGHVTSRHMAGIVFTWPTHPHEENEELLFNSIDQYKKITIIKRFEQYGI